jgi:hypothetical protein
MKEQFKYQIPSGLLDRLQHLLPLTDKGADEIVTEETEILDRIIPSKFRFLCECVKSGRWSLFWIPQMLMIATRPGDALYYTHGKEVMEEIGGELAAVIEDLLRAVDVEVLGLAKRSGKHTLSRYRVILFSIALCRAMAPARAS